MKQADMRTGGHYRATSGARVRILQKGVAGFSGRRDSVRVKFIGGPRDGQEAKLSSREILRAWIAADDERMEKRAALNKRVGAARVQLAALGFDGEGMRVTPRSGGTMTLQFWDDAAERLLGILERASEEDAA